ncbi:MAG: (Fe-S)-binding protein [Longimicrobiales bacterium]
MRATLFVTCLGDQFFADACADSAELLRSLGVDVNVARGQTCCGQPAYNAGHWPEARSMASHALEVLADAEYVVVPSGSCAAMMRRGYAELFGDDGGAAVAELAGRTFELAEFIVRVLGVDAVGSGLAGRRVAYHHGCHALRELGSREEPLTLLRNAGAELVEWEAAEECCGFGGLFSAKLPEVSAAMADRKLDTLPDPDIVTSADPGCLLHLSGRAAQRRSGPVFKHLAGVLWEAANGRT